MSEARIERLEERVAALIARQAATGKARDFTKYAADPVGFAREVLHVAPWAPKQIEMLESVRDHPLCVVRGANSVGKDAAVAWTSLWWVYALGGRVLLLGPTARQVEEILMRREIGRAFRSGELPGELLTTALRRTPGGEADILAMTSTEAGKLTGFHGDLVLVCITEAQDCEDFVLEGAMANATGARDCILLVGNPLRPTGTFYAKSRPTSQWHKIKIAASDHPNVVAGAEVIPGGVMREWVERQRIEWGAGSPQFIARVEAEFPDSDMESLYRRSWLERAVQLWESRALEKEAEYQEWVAGLDVARGGPDLSVLVLRQGPIVRRIVTWSGLDTVASGERMLRELAMAGLSPRMRSGFSSGRRSAMGPAPSIWVDEPGLGAGVIDSLRHEEYTINAFNGGERARRDERFLNRRAEAAFQLRNLLEAGKIALPRDELLFEELLGLRFTTTAGGKTQIEAKIELRERLKRSPDRADALMISLWKDSPGGITTGGALV